MMIAILLLVTLSFLASSQGTAIDSRPNFKDLCLSGKLYERDVILKLTTSKNEKYTKLIAELVKQFEGKLGEHCNKCSNEKDLKKKFDLKVRGAFKKVFKKDKVGAQIKLILEVIKDLTSLDKDICVNVRSGKGISVDGLLEGLLKDVGKLLGGILGGDESGLGDLLGGVKFKRSLGILSGLGKCGSGCDSDEEDDGGSYGGRGKGGKDSHEGGRGKGGKGGSHESGEGKGGKGGGIGQLGGGLLGVGGGKGKDRSREGGGGKGRKGGGGGLLGSLLGERKGKGKSGGSLLGVLDGLLGVDLGDILGGDGGSSLLDILGLDGDGSILGGGLGEALDNLLSGLLYGIGELLEKILCLVDELLDTLLLLLIGAFPDDIDCKWKDKHKVEDLCGKYDDGLTTLLDIIEDIIEEVLELLNGHKATVSKCSSLDELKKFLG